MNPIATRHTEKVDRVSNPKKMLNKWLAENVHKELPENFIDEDTGEVITIDRKEILFEKGRLIDNDVLAEINFFLQSGDLSSILVSNQRRVGFEQVNTHLNAWITQVEIEQKKIKLILYAPNIKIAHEILTDYMELSFPSGFYINMIKIMDYAIILEDSFKEINPEELLEKKFFQIDTKIVYNDNGEHLQQFIVHSIDIDKSLLVIRDFLEKKEYEYYLESVERKGAYTQREFQVKIEKAMPMPIGRFIPKEFSLAYETQF